MPVNKPILLCILDGFGTRDGKSADNAIAMSKTPCLDQLMSNFPNSLIKTSGLDVGLPEGQMGNSEVGHMNIGSGRIVMQDLPRIDRALADKTILQNKELIEFIEILQQKKGECHLFGLLSDGGVHSHYDHILTLADIITKYNIKVNIHGFLDGRDTPPNSGINYLNNFLRRIENNPLIKLVTLCGRYYAMDRDKRMDRVELAYNAMVMGEGKKVTDFPAAILKSYENNEFDEFVKPLVLSDYQGMKDNDGLFAGNFRADRMRQICEALLDPEFIGFNRKKIIKFESSISLTQYSILINKWCKVIFKPEILDNILGEIISRNGLKQLRIAETEKYAHVTFFFNGGVEKPFLGEERILIPSPKVKTYDLKPEMSAFEVTENLLANIEGQKFDLIVANYANADMVGHTGNMQAAIKAVETVDECLAKLVASILKVDGIMLITADHGNIEQMLDPITKIAHTAHTTGPVPLIMVANNVNNIGLKNGRLCDIAPTILQIMRINQPSSMTGESLIYDKK